MRQAPPVSRPQPRPVRFAMRKWGDRPHWEFTSLTLGRDELGDWYGTPVGTFFSRPGRQHLTENEHVILVPRPGLLGTTGTADWVATFYAPQAKVHTYVDITTPATATEGTVTCIDLDLDVVRDRADDRVWVDDEDEFAEHQLAFGYPPEVIADAVGVCEIVRRAVAEQRPPFDGSAEPWLAQLSRV